MGRVAAERGASRSDAARRLRRDRSEPACRLPRRPQRSRALTLLELLIAVAILTLLASISVPNLLEAQMRAKLVRVKADLRTLDGAMAAYFVDHAEYPPPASNGHGARLFRLSTPIAYYDAPTQPEPFRDQGLFTTPPYGYHGRNEHVNIFWNNDGNPGNFTGQPIVMWYLLRSSGPDDDRDGGGASALNSKNSRHQFVNFIYDPTNGTYSRGDLWRAGGAPQGNGLDSISLISR
jgi:prepilin-type N-terminal cleavage/methylation domain-containing protein